MSLVQKETEKRRNKEEKRKVNTVEGRNAEYVRFDVPIMVSVESSVSCNVTTILHRRR
jgi:hypothetical protein